jgi:hypothetical protein
VFKVTNHAIGKCCKEMSDAIGGVPNSFFRVEDNKVLYLTVGYVQTEQGPGFFDQVVLFCPFCGKQLQTKSQISDRVNA